MGQRDGGRSETEVNAEEEDESEKEVNGGDSGKHGDHTTVGVIRCYTSRFSAVHMRLWRSHWALCQRGWMDTREVL